MTTKSQEFVDNKIYFSSQRTESFVLNVKKGKDIFRQGPSTENFIFKGENFRKLKQVKTTGYDTEHIILFVVTASVIQKLIHNLCGETK